MTKDTHLTNWQIQVLKLRFKGQTQVDISRKFKTSRANISATEKKAMINIEKSKNTLNLALMLRTALLFTVSPGEDLNDVVTKIYNEADSNKIHITKNFPALANLIQKKGQGKVEGRFVRKKIDIAITEEGDILIR
jgi:Tfx family DNA-binding protein|tara:strand:- start:366 stop:773 length:408 start_codon:yes stop_codon:yes gene_type:complete